MLDRRDDNVLAFTDATAAGGSSTVGDLPF